MNHDLSLSSVIELFNGVLTIVPPAIALTAILFYLRTGNMFIIMNKIWMFFVNKDASSNETIKKFNQEMLEITNFRFLYGIRVSNRDEICKIENFKDKFQLSIEELLWLRKYFNLTQMRFRTKPGRITKISNAISFVLSISILFFASLIGLSNGVYIRMNESTNYYILTETNVAEITLKNVYSIATNNTFKFNKICNAENKSNTNDLSLICEFTRNPTEYKSYLKENIKSQRLIGGMFFFISLIWYILSIRDSISIIKTRKLQGLLLEKYNYK